MSTENIKEVVKEKYGKAALKAAGGSQACCGGSSCCATDVDPITTGLYDEAQTQGLPQEAILASLGCGNPTALAQLNPGEIVFDLGSGGGIDVLLSARRVGPTGKAYGLDMTDEMLALARQNQAKAGVENVEFLKGEIEQIPLPDNSVDVIISNCVINLSADKDRVLREAFRVLKPGGRLAVSDVVVRGEIPTEIRKNVELWIGCVAGALEERDYRAKLVAAGFETVDLEPTRVYRAEEARGFLQGAGIDVDAIAAEIDGKFASMFVRATRPAIVGAATVEVYDPAMCCSTGVCGPSVDPVLPRFAADLDWLARKGVNVTRFNLAQEPKAFTTNSAVKAALSKEGTSCLPLISVNGAVVSKGSYPDRAALAGWTGVAPDQSGLSLPVLDSGAKSGCC
jgi:2-polyprenyl-3-methyl-5-hydroxy-6-metoxy-1,4-benzoquinol methylase